MEHNQISNQSADAVLFEVFDILVPKKDFSRLQWWSFRKALYNPVIMHRVITWFKIDTVLKGKLLHLSENSNIHFVMMGAGIDKVVENYMEKLGLIFVMVRACRNRIEFDDFMKFYQIKYYYSLSGRDIFDRVLPGMQKLDWSEI